MKAITLSLPPIETNCYVIFSKIGGECIIVDPASSFDKIKEIVSENKLKPKCIFLTHGHFDHIGASDELRSFYDIPLLVHEFDSEMILQPNLNCSSMMGTPFALSPADKLVSDGDEIHIDNEVLRVMHTPGHTPGSSVLVGSEEIFSGDTIFLNSYGRCDLPGGNFEKLKESIFKIMALNEKLKVYPGHGDTTDILSERLFYFGK